MTDSPRLSGVVLALDVDGVVLEAPNDPREHWLKQFTRRFGVEADELRTTFFKQWWPEIIVGRQPIEVGLAEVFSSLGWNIDVEDALACWFDGDFFVDNDVVSAAKEWSSRGARVVLATDQERRRVSYLERHLSPLLPFCGIAYSGQLGHQKVEAAFYPAAENFLGVSQREVVVFVDDRVVNVTVAQQHGWLGWHFEKGDDWRRGIESLLLRASRRDPTAPE
ncbi:MAG TPA: hypothetical protein VND89_01310 [Acidimicrobiales bacterium]|nr:hypothetical protein [Acidimicrobiales bacterium]